jgi:hypothetical protein
MARLVPGKYRWVPSTDDVSPGTARKDDATDQQCQHCGRWFENRGVTGHEKGCEFRDVDWFWVDDDGFVRSEDRLGSAFERVDESGGAPVEG